MRFKISMQLTVGKVSDNPQVLISSLIGLLCELSTFACIYVGKNHAIDNRFSAFWSFLPVSCYVNN